jgi:hypothetical protein
MKTHEDSNEQNRKLHWYEQVDRMSIVMCEGLAVSLLVRGCRLRPEKTLCPKAYRRSYAS